MADKIVKKGSTNVSVELYIVDNTNGTPELGVLYNTAGIDLNYRRDLAAVTTITEVTLAALTTAHADGGFKEIANGRYRLDLPDAAFATGVSEVTIGGTVTGMVVYPVTVQLVDYDPEDSAALGLTAVPATVAGSVGSVVGLSVSDILTTQMTESYATDGTAPTLAQAIFNLQQTLGDFAITGTTISVKRIDGSTEAMTYTLDDATTPTSRTRTT